MVDTLHAADALVVVHRRRAAGGGLADGPLGTAEGAGVAGKAVETVDLHEGTEFLPLLGGQVGFLQQPYRMLLAVDILARDVEVLVVVESQADVLCNLVGGLATAKHGTGALADADGVAHTVDLVSEKLAAFDKQLVVGRQAGADVDDVDVVDDLFGARNGFEVFTLGDDCAGDASVVGVGNGPHKSVACHDGDAETTDTVGLHGESAFAGHGLDDGADGGAGLDTLVRGEVADVAGTHGEHSFAQQGMFLVHHLLEHSGGVDTGHIVVLKCRHERHSTGGHHQVLCVDIGHLSRDDVLDGEPTPL